MPHAIDLDYKYKKQGLQVVLVHVQNDPVDLTAFVMKRFPKNLAMVTANNPLMIGDSLALKLPMAALFGVDGKIIAVGHRNKVGRLIDQQIPKELAKLKAGWGAAPEIAKARSLMHSRGKLTEAKKILDTFQPSSPSAKEDLARAKNELKNRFSSDLNAIKYLMGAGRWLDAKKDFDALHKGTADVQEWAEAKLPVKQQFDEYIGKNELKLDKKVSKIIRASLKGVKEGMSAKLRKAVGAMTGLKVAKRALWYASTWERVLQFR